MLAYALSICIGLAALAVSLGYAVKRLRETDEILERVVTRKQNQSERVRRVARACLGVRRDVAAARRRKTTMELGALDLEEKLKAAGGEGNRLIVLDDRRTKADAGWVIHVVNPEYASKVNSGVDPLAQEGWRRGRRYIVWALDEAKARDKFSARYPDKRGFQIQKIEKY